MNQTLHVPIVILAGAAVTGGCGGTIGEGLAFGEDGGPCYGNATCNDGLMCDATYRCIPATEPGVLFIEPAMGHTHTLPMPTAPSTPPPAPPPPSPGGLWPNEPPGLVVETNFDIADETPRTLPTSMSAVLSAGGDWTHYDIYSNMDTDIIVDPTEPSGMGKSVRYTYDADWINGATTGSPYSGIVTHQFNDRSVERAYFGAIMKVSDNFVWHPANGTKLLGWNGRSGASETGGLNGIMTRHQVDNQNQLGQQEGGVDCHTVARFSDTIQLQKNTWYRFEWYQARPDRYPGFGTEYFWITPWTGSQWGEPVKILDEADSRWYCSGEERWIAVKTLPIWGGKIEGASAVLPITTGDFHMYSGAMTLRVGQ